MSIPFYLIAKWARCTAAAIGEVPFGRQAACSDHAGIVDLDEYGARVLLAFTNVSKPISRAELRHLREPLYHQVNQAKDTFKI